MHRENRQRLIAASRKVALVLSVSVLASALSGCVAVAAGAAAGAGVAYLRGDLEATVSQSPGKVANAAERAFEELDIRTISKASSSIDAQVIGRTARDEKVQVTVKTAEGGGSRLAVRVGVFGDEAMSRRIYDEIREQL